MYPGRLIAAGRAKRRRIPAQSLLPTILVIGLAGMLPRCEASVTTTSGRLSLATADDGAIHGVKIDGQEVAAEVPAGGFCLTDVQTGQFVRAADAAKLGLALKAR